MLVLPKVFIGFAGFPSFQKCKSSIGFISILAHRRHRVRDEVCLGFVFKAFWSIPWFLTFVRKWNLVFSIGFIRVFDMVEHPMRFIYKRNAFFDYLDPVLHSGLENHQ